MQYNDEQPHKSRLKQTHVHEFSSPTHLAVNGELRHNHRFAGVTGEAVPLSYGSHKHALMANTDYFFNHFHGINAETGPAIDVGNGKHLHFVESTSTINFEHRHDFQFATLIDNPSL